MLKTKKSYLIATTMFVVAQIILGYFIQNVSGFTYGILTVSSVFLAWLFILFNLDKKQTIMLTFIALCFTVCADVFLSGLINNENCQLIAMFFFSAVQLSYFLRLYLNHTSKKQRLTHVIARSFSIILAIILTIIVLKSNANALSIITMFYFANLLLNIIFAFMQINKSILFPIGLVFFALCDIIIGLGVLDSAFIPIPEASILYKLIHTGINLAWIFYVPSQTLIALSIKEELLFRKKIERKDAFLASFNFYLIIP